MKKYLLMLFVLLSGMIYIASAQPETGTFDVGFDQKLIFVNPNDLWEASSMLPINYYFPETFISDYSAVRFGYTSSEMGGQSRLLTQMKLPFVGITSGGPAGFWEVLGIAESNTPVEVAIFIRNASYLPASGGAVDTSAEHGWVKVWDDAYNYATNEYEEIDLNGSPIQALVINFKEPFLYAGAVLEVVMVNKSGIHSLDRDNVGDISNLTYTYPFLLFASDDASFSSTNYPGPAWAGEGILWDWVSYINNGYEDEGTNFFTLNQNSYSLSLTGGFYRPIVQFTYQEKQNLVGIGSNMPDPVKLDEYNYNLMSLLFRTKGEEYPLNIAKFTFKTKDDEGEKYVENITKIKIYYTESLDKFDSETAVLVGEYEFEDPIKPGDEFDVELSESISLLDGDNYFWMVYEIPTSNSCGDILSIQLQAVNIIDYGVSLNYVFNTAPSEKPKHRYETAIDFSPVKISSANPTTYVVCRSFENGYTIKLEVEGAVDKELWEGSNDGVNWVTIDNNSENRYELNLVNDDYSYFRYTAFGPSGCSSSEDSYIFEVNYVDPIGEVTIECLTDVNLIEPVKEGEVLTFKATVDNVPPAIPTSYRWQVNNNGVWIDILPELIPSANTDELEIVVDAQKYYGFFRCIVEQIDIDNPTSCQLSYISEPIPVTVVSSEFFFTEHPSKKAILCEGEDFELYFAYSGVYEEGYWLHDGEIMYDEYHNPISDQILTIKNVERIHEGTYNFVAKAYDRDEDGNFVMREFKTRDAELYVINANSVLEQPEEKTYAEMGGNVLFEFTADVRGEYDYQWYKHTVGGDIELNNNYKYKGTKSNVLSISFLEADDFTYNGDYYFCKINGQCSVTETEPAYLLTKENQLFITQQPQNTSFCVKKDFPIRLSVEVLQQSSTLEYQWYKNDTALADNARIKGATTSNLVITPSRPLDSDKYWVTITETKTGAQVKSNEVDVVVTDLVSLADTIYNFGGDTTMYVQEGDYVVLLTTPFKAAGTVTFEVIFNDTTESESVPQIPVDPNGYFSLALKYNIPNFQPNQAGLYVLKVYNECDTVVRKIQVVLVDKDGNPIETITSSVKDNQSDLVLNISPNPVTNRMNLKFNSEELNTIIELLDISGSRIATVFDGMAQSGLNVINYDLSKLNLSSGTYFIKYTQGTASQVRPFIFVK